jgi:2-keto-4-pentenoate hydratase/2-oxohepta-3-ene-1,7-dioic acid hydratase in catechol pathway
MPIPVIRYAESGRVHWGVVFGARIAPLHADPVTTSDLVSHHWDQLWALTADQASIPLSTVQLLAPVTVNQQFICQGINYRSHVEESGVRLSDVPFNTLFTKASSSITAANAPIVCPRHVALLDYEVELGLVVRRELPPDTAVSPDALGDWLAGVTIVNDLSARDIQLPQGQFYKGKSYRGFGPVGPYLVLLKHEEWRRWPELHMRLSVNGQLRQDAMCAEMIHHPAPTLSELSTIQDLHAGDLIATGTSAGCVARAPGKLTMWIARHFLSDATKWRLFIKKGRRNPAYLRPGDRIVASIRTDDGLIDLGEQTTTITRDEGMR